MTHARRALAAELSANDVFKLHYPRYLRGAVLAALILTALLVWLWPDIEAKPYRLRETEEMIWIDVADPAPLIDPPAPLEMPRIPPIIEAAPDDEPGLKEPGWTSDRIWDPPPVHQPKPSDYDGFVASSALPRITYQAKADYPEIARRSGLEGTVLVHVLVTATGRVDQAVVIQGAHPLLDKAALAAARQCRFTPAQQRALKVKAWVAVPYRFRLK